MRRGEEEEEEEGEGEEREEDTSAAEKREWTGVHLYGRCRWRRGRDADTVFGRGGSTAEAGVVMGTGAAAEHLERGGNELKVGGQKEEHPRGSGGYIKWDRNQYELGGDELEAAGDTALIKFGIKSPALYTLLISVVRSQRDELASLIMR